MPAAMRSERLFDTMIALLVLVARLHDRNAIARWIPEIERPADTPPAADCGRR
jgi:hypothetical protein